jgi:hypothetical protein
MYLVFQGPLVEQELLTLPEQLHLPSVFSGVRVTRSLVLCVCFVDCCLSFIFCPSIYGLSHTVVNLYKIMEDYPIKFDFQIRSDVKVTLIQHDLYQCNIFLTQTSFE